MLDIYETKLRNEIISDCQYSLRLLMRVKNDGIKSKSLTIEIAFFVASFSTITYSIF